MADAVTTQTLENGNKWVVLLLSNLSDGTGESAVKKFDVATAGYAVNGIAPGRSVSIWEVEYDCKTLSAALLWEATADQPAFILGGFGRLKYRRVGGLKCPQVAGATGSLKVTTRNNAAGASYSILLIINKNISFPTQAAA